MARYQPEWKSRSRAWKDAERPQQEEVGQLLVVDPKACPPQELAAALFLCHDQLREDPLVAAAVRALAALLFRT